MDKELLKLIIDLIEVKAKHDTLINYLINNADLNYAGTELRMNNAEEIIRALEPEKYKARFDILICEKKENE